MRFQEVILTAAPEPARQFRSECGFLRNEHAAAPYFAPIASLLPRTLAVDFTHDLVGRDYVIQSVVPGIPAPEVWPGTTGPGGRRSSAASGRSPVGSTTCAAPASARAPAR